MQSFNLSRGFRKFFLSIFVIVSFGAYALKQQMSFLDRQDQAFSSPPSAPANPPVTGLYQPTSTSPYAAPTEYVTSTPYATATQAGLYKDGSYTGPEVDVFYGLVQIKAIIQNGMITDVQFLEYPNDRRTSQMINAQVMPWLKQEAIQSQSANVNIITGATLTSEGFMMSLQAALQTAQG